ncbi:UNVERIFIED_CONTAM: hypothetical protein HDU68_007408, partial [Siphonaria sp. JEL0065]
RRLRRKLDHLPTDLTCTICDIKFGRKYDLSRHLENIHPTPEQDVLHECHFCGKEFGRADSLRRHVKVTKSCSKFLVKE